MKIKTKITLIVGIILIVLIYGICYGVYGVNITLAEIDETSRLVELSNELFTYCERKHGWPNSLKEVAPDEMDRLDRISKKPLIYFPNAKSGTNDVLLAQPEPYRTRLWPFGKMRRRGMLANGNKVDLDKGKEK